jgi:hypothetical protein
MNNNETAQWETGCPKDCDCLGFGHGGLEITISADDIKREVREILEAADRATPTRRDIVGARPGGKSGQG